MLDAINHASKSLRIKMFVFSDPAILQAVIAAHKLNERPIAIAAVVERLLAQQAKDGGWITDYDKDGKPVAEARVRAFARHEAAAAPTADQPKGDKTS